MNHRETKLLLEISQRVAEHTEEIDKIVQVLGIQKKQIEEMSEILLKSSKVINRQTQNTNDLIQLVTQLQQIIAKMNNIQLNEVKIH